jgi:hypothetical protein
MELKKPTPHVRAFAEHMYATLEEFKVEEPSFTALALIAGLTTPDKLHCYDEDHSELDAASQQELQYDMVDNANKLLDALNTIVPPPEPPDMLKLTRGDKAAIFHLRVDERDKEFESNLICDHSGKDLKLGYFLAATAAMMKYAIRELAKEGKGLEEGIEILIKQALRNPKK